MIIEKNEWSVDNNVFFFLFSWCRNAHNLFFVKSYFYHASSCLTNFFCSIIHKFCDFFGEFFVCLYFGWEIFQIFYYSLFHCNKRGLKGKRFLCFFCEEIYEFFFLQRGFNFYWTPPFDFSGFLKLKKSTLYLKKRIFFFCFFSSPKKAYYTVCFFG